MSLAWADLRDGVLSVHIWPMLAWQEIKQRYRRSTLGPFWLTISTGALIGGMGPLYGKLFGRNIGEYFPFLAIGYILWQLLASILTEAGQTFVSAEQYIKQIRLPLAIHVLQMVWRNLIVFAHNLIIIVLVLMIYPPRFDWWLVTAPLGVLAIAVNGMWIGLLLGMVCTRFRDIPPIISSLVQVCFFLTPVLWQPGMLGRHAWAVNFNPFFHFLEVVRAPLLGKAPNLLSWLVVFCITVGGFGLTLAIFARFRARIAYWL